MTELRSTTTGSALRRLFLDVHALQTLPPANVNRDDSGSPKQALYGGIRRARVSSQAWKRATRLYLAERQDRETSATRTKRLASLVAAALAARTGLEKEAALRVCAAVVRASGIKMADKRPDQTSYLIFLGRGQVDAIAAAIAPHAASLAALADKELDKAAGDIDIKPLLEQGHPLEVLLFGRMVADLADINVDATAQVAHAISTHAVDTEYDYYTAVDDENPAEDSGAGMIGTVEFNSATFYRYATLAVHALAEALPDADAAAEAARRFVEAFALSMPTGHQNAFAHRTRPDLVLAVLRGDQPVNLVTAFEEPVTSREGIVRLSMARLAAELDRAGRMWSDRPLLVVCSRPADGSPDLEPAFGPPLAFDDLLGQVAVAVAAHLEARPR